MHVLDLRERELRVLVVDDDVVVPTLLAIDRPDLLVDEVTRASAVDAALRRAVPDAVVVDRWLPDADGLDVVRRLRRSSLTRQVPVVVARARPQPGDGEAVLRAGADAEVAKPIDSALLADVVRRLVAVAPEELRVRRQRHLRLLRETGRSPGIADLPQVVAPVAEPEVVARRRRRLWGRRRRRPLHAREG